MWQNYSVETAYDRQEVKEFLERFQLQYYVIAGGRGLFY